MGKGLIPADLATWKLRRRAIVPAFHQAYLAAMVDMFVHCTQRSVDKLDAAIGAAGPRGARVNMEDEFLSLGLDIIGLGVFNYDFDSVTTESPVIKAVYRCLREAVRPPAPASSWRKSVFVSPTRYLRTTRPSRTARHSRVQTLRTRAHASSAYPYR